MLGQGVGLCPVNMVMTILATGAAKEICSIGQHTTTREEEEEEEGE